MHRWPSLARRVAASGTFRRWYDAQIQQHEDNLARLLTAAQVVDDALGDLHGEYGSAAVGVAHGCLQAAIVEAERHLTNGPARAV